MFGHDQVPVGHDVLRVVDHLLDRVEAEAEAGDDRLGAVGHVVVRGRYVRVLGFGGEQGGQAIPVLGVQQAPEAVDGGSLRSVSLTAARYGPVNAV